MIRVEFWNQVTGAWIATKELAPEELRACLDSTRTQVVGDATYQYHRSEPADVAGASQVKVWVHEIRLVSPQDLLFSLPTINDFVPEATAPATRPDILRFHEDDWRQMEVVSNGLAEAVEACFEKIREVYREARKGGGFTRVHIRSEVPRPLEGVTLKVADLRRRVLGDHPRSHKYHGVSFEKCGGVIESGFAFRTPPGLTLYGLEERGLVHTLGMVDAPSAWEDPFFRLLGDYDLRMVNWVQAQTLLPPR